MKESHFPGSFFLARFFIDELSRRVPFGAACVGEVKTYLYAQNGYNFKQRNEETKGETLQFMQFSRGFSCRKRSMSH